MNDTITIEAGIFKSFVHHAFKNEFAIFTRRYFNLGEELSHEIFPTVVNEFYLKIKSGELELLEKPKRNLEKIGADIVLKFLRNQLPDLIVGANPAN